MNEKILRKPNGTIIGRIRDLGGRIEARSGGGALLGWYDPGSDKTRKASGELVSMGNTLSMLF